MGGLGELADVLASWTDETQDVHAVGRLWFPLLLAVGAACSLWAGVLASQQSGRVHAAARPSAVPSLQGSTVAKPLASGSSLVSPTVTEAPLSPAPSVVPAQPALEVGEAVRTLPNGVEPEAPGEPIAELADALLERMNRARQVAGLPALLRDTRLDEVAYARAEDLARENYFAHVGPDGASAFTELRARGIRYRLAGENLARNTFPREQTVDIAFEGLMASPGHRANILEPAFSRVGIAVLRVEKTWLFVTVFVDEMVGDGGLEPPTPSL